VHNVVSHIVSYHNNTLQQDSVFHGVTYVTPRALPAEYNINAAIEDNVPRSVRHCVREKSRGLFCNGEFRCTRRFVSGECVRRFQRQSRIDCRRKFLSIWNRVKAAG
jgi:hypothetical protein